MKDHHHQYLDFFTTLSQDSLPQLHKLFAPDAHFKDPFNDVYGISAIKRIFSHMFVTTLDPQFTITHAAMNELGEEDSLLIAWEFTFHTPKNVAYAWEGSSRVSFDPEGSATEHIDYWDPAQAIYAKLPVIGSLIRLLGRKLSTPE